VPPHHANGPEADKRPRLDSWKEIAAYLNRDVRTAHRWEQDEGLPVHRHRHSRRGTVYAYPDEIDAWVSQRSAGGNALPADATRRPTLPRLVAAAAVLMAVLALTFWVLSPAPTTPAPAATAPVRLLVTGTENRTDEERFNGVVDGYLQGELSTSSVELIPPDRIVETLTLMRQPTDRELNIALILDIAARNPDVDLILTSALDRFGTEYALTVEVLNPATGSVLDTVRSRASAESRIPTALVDLVAGTLAAVAGIDVPTRAVPPGHERVTTASQRAIELYWAASYLMLNQPFRMPAAEEGLRQAVDLDPEFATAHIQLAYAIHDRGRPPAEWEPFANRALELVDTVSPPERLFIVGSYHKLHRDLEAAYPQLLALAESYPDHFWGQRQMAGLSHALGNLEGAAFSMALAADLQPRALGLHMTAFNFILTTPHPWTLPRIHERLLELNPPSENGNVHPFLPAEFYTVNRLLLDGEADDALREAEALRLKLDTLPASGIWTRRPEYAARLAEIFLALGRLADAEDLLRMVREDDGDDPRNNPRTRLVDEQRLSMLLSISRHGACCPGADASPNLRDIGLFLFPDIAIQRIRSSPADFDETPLRRAPAETPETKILRGELARLRGNRAEAIELLSSALDEESERLRTLGLSLRSSEPSPRHFFLAAESLADALVGEGRAPEAVDVLEQWSSPRAKVGAFMGSPSFAPIWTNLRWKLEALYRATGRHEDADTIRAELGRLLARADDDHFVATTLRAG